MDEKLITKQPLGGGIVINVSKHHTFGTDACLLANFSSPKKNDKLVDLGTGCGIIPYLILRDVPIQSVYGVDISEEAIYLCEKTKKELKTENFKPILSNLLDLKGKISFGNNTLITCNPPYKAPSAGIKNKDDVNSVARHEVACTLKDIIEVSSKLLQTCGRLCMCHRPERLSELMFLMKENKIEPKRLRLVCQKVGKEPWLVLVEGVKCGKTGLRIMPTLYVEENGEYSKEMIEIYGLFKEAYL